MSEDKVEFSDKALDGLKESHDNNVFTAVKSSWSLVILFSISLLFASVALWAVYGKVTVSVQGSAITLLSGGVSPVVAPSDGVISSINVSEGAHVLSNQVIGQIRNNRTFYDISKESNLLFTKRDELNLKLASVDPSSPEAKILQRDLESIKSRINFLKQYTDDVSYIRVGATGTIIELLKESGIFVKAGERVALIASSKSNGIYLVAFVPAKSSRNIRAGMRAFFSPSAAPASRYGYVNAVVRDVSDMPINRETILRELMNESLTELLAGDQAMIRVVLELVPNEDSLSGYSWTGGRDYEFPISSGMVGEVIINTEYRAPLSYLLPSFKKSLDKD